MHEPREGTDEKTKFPALYIPPLGFNVKYCKLNPNHLFVVLVIEPSYLACTIFVASPSQSQHVACMVDHNSMNILVDVVMCNIECVCIFTLNTTITVNKINLNIFFSDSILWVLFFIILMSSSQAKNLKWKYMYPARFEPVTFCNSSWHLRPLGHTNRW